VVLNLAKFDKIWRNMLIYIELGKIGQILAKFNKTWLNMAILVKLG